MKNINEAVYNKILVQVEEAKILGLEKLASRVLSVMLPVPRDEKEKITYSSKELEDDVNKKLWKIAMDVIAYYDLQSIDIQKMDEVINDLSSVVTSSIQDAADVHYKVGPLEPKLPGESK